MSDRRPNIVFILTDDHAAHAISAYGSQLNSTPALDRIAAEGVRFDEAACTNALCAPSRATILTGTHSHRNGVRTLMTPIDSTQPTFPAMLQQAGYRTAIFGKWHLGHGPGHDPVGFDTWRVLPEQGEYYDPVLIGPDGPEPHQGYVTEILTDLALDWLAEQTDDQSWCLLLWHKAPHRRWQSGPNERHLYQGQQFSVPDTFFDDYQGRATAASEAAIRVADDLDDLDTKGPPPPGLSEREHAIWMYQRFITDYLRCVAGVDRSTARVLDALDDRGQADRTLVTYASDQGFFLGDHGWFDKRFMYRESMNLPLMMRYPGKIEPGTSSDALVLNLDLAQTFLDYAGIPAHERMQGASLKPLLDGSEPLWRAHTYYRYWDHLKAGVGAHCGLRTRRYKLIHYYGQGLEIPGALNGIRDPEWELFDLEADPQELRNVYHDPSHTGVRNHLTTLLIQAIDEADDHPPPSLLDSRR